MPIKEVITVISSMDIQWEGYHDLFAKTLNDPTLPATRRPIHTVTWQKGWEHIPTVDVSILDDVFDYIEKSKSRAFFNGPWNRIDWRLMNNRFPSSIFIVSTLPVDSWISKYKKHLSTSGEQMSSDWEARLRDLYEDYQWHIEYKTADEEKIVRVDTTDPKWAEDLSIKLTKFI